MSEWLGKSRIEEEDIKKSQPTLAKYFPILVKYFTEDQRMRVTVIFPYEMADKFKKAVIKEYGSFTPTTINKAATKALQEWIEKRL